MEKLVYLLHPEASVAAAVVRDGLLQEAVPGMRAESAERISVNLFDEAVEQGTAVVISHSDPPIRAAVTFWLENSDDRAGCEALLSAQAAQLAGYLVVESRPVIHHPPIGERAPGYNLVSRIFKRPDISDASFIQRWNHEHREVALATQSTFSYVRNAVVRTLTADAPACDGIVEESFPIEALTDPHAWYNCDSEEEYQRRLARMMDSVMAFLDLEPLESIPMSEYWMG